ncbi:hypothetical protein [cf. Phormidesmis sp. LEGE 11477]|uniref:hypothetical protein n=1 Tax=cf. Phormidesmis sp. LEGE 11477 TaxID=1828680 RepID=UPI001880764E|nr:hypothetical protein [cf. Phormidesmis sp. LEGE 11477]MBE9061929.1 hypothetical protein [cf. Phormidesmis sp. LEGE 11477]
MAFVNLLCTARVSPLEDVRKQSSERYIYSNARMHTLLFENARGEREGTSEAMPKAIAYVQLSW